LHLLNQRHDALLDGVAKRNAILGVVIEAVLALPGVAAVVVVPRVVGDLLALGQELVEDVIARVAVFEPGVGHELPGFLAHVAVGFFLEHRHLLDRALLAAEVDHDGPDDLVVILGQLGALHVERDVFFAEQLDIGAPLLEHHGKALRVELIGEFTS